MTDLGPIEAAHPPSGWLGKNLRLSREERDHIAGYALDSIEALAKDLALFVSAPDQGFPEKSSTCARKIAALSNLLGDIGWEREGEDYRIESGVSMQWNLGELFPVAQLRPWLEEWQCQDDAGLLEIERKMEVWGLEAEEKPRDLELEGHRRQLIADAQTKLGTGAILLARIEKWMASHGN